MIGLGVSYLATRVLLDRAIYQQAIVTSLYKVMKEVPQLTGGCTAVDPIATVTGRSEGGSAAVVGALALKQAGVEIVGVHVGESIVNFNYNLGAAIGT